MSEIRVEVVYARWWNVDRLTTTGVELIWHTEWVGERVIRRALIDLETGDILDEAWLDHTGRVRSYASVVRRARRVKRGLGQTG